MQWPRALALAIAVCAAPAAGAVPAGRSLDDGGPPPRAGYRYGLPLAEAEVFDEPGMVLTSGSSVRVSAGTVAWLQLDLNGFREIAGRRIMRLEAVPGLRFRFWDTARWEAGFGVLAAFRPASEAPGLAIERLAGVVQLSGRF